MNIYWVEFFQMKAVIQHQINKWLSLTTLQVGFGGGEKYYHSNLLRF